MDEGDNDPTRFLTYLVAALQTLALSKVEGIAPNIGAGVLGALQSPQPPPIESILTALINEIATIPDNFILVLDDYHIIDSKPVDNALAFLLEHLPPQIRVGMFPDIPESRFHQIGNAAGMGAVQLLIAQPNRQQMESYGREIHCLELTTHQGFQDAFVNQMGFAVA